MCVTQLSEKNKCHKPFLPLSKATSTDTGCVCELNGIEIQMNSFRSDYVCSAIFAVRRCDHWRCTDVRRLARNGTFVERKKFSAFFFCSLVCESLSYLFWSFSICLLPLRVFVAMLYVHWLCRTCTRIRDSVMSNVLMVRSNSNNTAVRARATSWAHNINALFDRFLSTSAQSIHSVDVQHFWTAPKFQHTRMPLSHSFYLFHVFGCCYIVVAAAPAPRAAYEILVQISTQYKYQQVAGPDYGDEKRVHTKHILVLV